LGYRVIGLKPNKPNEHNKLNKPFGEVMKTNKINRKLVLSKVKRVVIKVGTRLLTDKNGNLDKKSMRQIAEQIVGLKKAKKEVLLVSSGAIGAGMGYLGFKTRPKTIPKEQAAAAIGQCQLMRIYDQIFENYGCRIAQVLLTQSDLRHRRKYLNICNAISTLISYGVIPVINENDTVAIDELEYGDKFGDNDILAALVANLADAEFLILLTDVDGV
jgi:glutamate 5-kinase